MVELIDGSLDRLGVPAACDLRTAAIALARVFDGDDRAGHMAPASAALLDLMRGTREIYGSLSLEEALEMWLTPLTDEGDTDG
ncbi:hypothetical protein [Microbacterium kunmingense]|uniref:hypothetical protein n=1 Tax=Microbacterium kunmingense TaxID=2915939 RepID=UPI00200689E3|nr:hypothetical protein [Microbacterium kunmingense]